MDRTALLQRFDGRSRLLAHALYSGTEGARKAQIVFNKQRRCDPHFSLAPFLESLCQQEACLLEDELVLKPLACVFSDVFKRNLLCFLHLIHPGYPKDSVLHLLQCLSKEDGEKQWVSALITQLKRDIEGARKGTLLSSNCTETLKSLCGRFRDTDVKGGWTSCFEVLEAKGEETDMSVLSQKKRKSDKMDLDEDTQEDPQSKKVKMDFSSSKDEERMIEEEEAEIRRSEMDQSAGSVSQARSDLLGFSKNLPDHMKAALPVIKELLDAESEWDDSSVSALKVLHECDPNEVEVLCSVLCLSEVSEQSLPQFCSCLLKLTPDLSHSTASALITHLLLNKILSLAEPASRCLVTAVTSLCSRYPRPTCQALIEPLLQKGQLGSAQADLLCRLVIDCLEPHHRLLVFRTALGASWDEGVLSVIHALLDSKLELSQEDFCLFAEHLCSQSPHFSKSMKFAKMLLSILTKYQSNVNPACHHTLSSVLSFNETFLKKSLQAALKRISF
ncbi:Fanconi anemia group E protein [Danio aesculapii]|uniref:Fanconi anemia group E protein n=1 Tax=Danio aesculapii TaxID=1142201 RepID=UPI0024C0C8DA|nr:Fanconi anemia group E protein [Danio aesculapii]